uniref:Uncharacterized protein n=1 Tax=Sinocyclocheilus rhinocerous TaxID=307959 RepID=A0A673JUC8_9TELE
MAFFGITYLGYQNPFGDRISCNYARTKWRNSLLISDISVRSCASLSAPKELYRVPVTDNQQYGWWVSSGGLKNQEPWTQTRRFPRKNSEMTKYEAM